MILIGSQTSPFVRRIRILAASLKISYEFKNITTRSEEGQALLLKYSPIRRIPLLVLDNEEVVFDSTLIAEYLLESVGQKISLKEKLVLKLVDELNDSLVILYQLKNHGSDVNWSTDFSKNHLKRVEDIFGVLDQDYCSQIKVNSISEIWLYCLLDWNNFRNVFATSKYKNLMDFHSRVTLNSRELISASMPSI